MWLFKSKHNHQQDDKNYLPQQNQKMLKEMKTKFQQKMKKLSKNIKQSQNYFQYYSSISPKDQQLITSFQQMMKTLQGLISIIQQLKKQVDHLSNDLIQLQKLKEMIGNHHTIINTIQDMHTVQINKIHQHHNTITSDFSLQIQQANQLILKTEREKQEIQNRLTTLQQNYSRLQRQNQKLAKQNILLREQYDQKQMMYNQLFEKNTQSKKVVNLNSIKLQYIFYYNRLKQNIFKYFQIPQIIQMKKINKFYRHLIKVNQSQLIFKKMKQGHQKRQLKNIVNLKYYQRILELFPIENIKVNALKYLYFKIKPATYILPYLQEQLQLIDEKESQDKSESKHKFNWRQLFSMQKSKKEENKFSIAQLKNISQFKKIENKIETIFRGILSFKLPEDLLYYSNTMQNQLKQLKINLNEKVHNKESYLIWASQLHCLTKFMYLQTNELYNLLQVIFGQLVIKNRDLISIREKHDELRQNQGMLRSLIQNISYDKSNIQKKYLIMQNQLIKNSLQRDILSNNLLQMSRQCEQLRTKYQVLHHEYKNIHKTLEKYQEDKKKQENNLRLIKEEIDKLQLKNDNKHPRKYSTISLQQDH